ncbi:caspase-2 [Folsomia candida]|uniref:Caspase-2 n=1 Tax=Folsomia candida TaxID=158441 RepID=A0A226E7J9_FOLCA|nr:caspase-2 [Folsomia candida]OXA53399.1 Caspase-2 [Folsomia candida]
MSSKPRGVALIMNNMFEKKKGEKRINSPRDGCEHDEKYMGNLFQQLGFNTFVAKNVAKDRIVAVMEKYRSLITEEMDCFVFVIMSHGQLNEIQMADGNSMNIYADFLPEITRKMAPAFSEKPKLVFFQACQSLEKKKKFESHDGSGQSKNETETSSVDHVRLFFPALPADVARRQSATGSRFIYALTKVFMEQAHEKHIDGLRNEVAKVMKNMELPPGFERQNPKMDILGECDKLYFNPGL